MRRVVLAIALLSACGPVHEPINTAPPTPRSGWHEAVDWTTASEEAVSLLQSYLRVDTRNPGAYETDGARFLAAVLDREGIDSSIHEFAPGRGSLVARIRGDGTEKPLCLLSHIDVVPWEDAGWEGGPGPMSGEIDADGVLWGRGIVDMKGMGAIELMTLVWLQRLEVPLKRDVILLAVADEEVHNGGSKFVADELWGDIQCSQMVNEGGFGVPGVFFEDQTVYGVSVAEKGTLWLRVWASGDPGHGSTPRPDEAPTRLLTVIERLASRKPETTYHGSFDELFFQVGNGRGGLAEAVLTHPRSARKFLKGRLLDNPLTAAMITDTVHLTGMTGANKPNVIPGEVAAVYDCRLLPGHEPDDLLAELQALTADLPYVRFEVIQKWKANDSPIADPFYAALTHHLIQGRDDAVAAPIVSVGFTDSIIFRPLGVNAYGIAPFELSPEELATAHGNGERMRASEVGRGLRILFSAVVDVSASADAPPEATDLPAVARVWTEPQWVPWSPDSVGEASEPAEGAGAPEGAESPEGASSEGGETTGD